MLQLTMRSAHRNLVATVAALMLNAAAVAQHSDVEFEFEDGKIHVEFGPEGRVFEGEFPTSGLFAQFTDDPGFESHAPITPGTSLDYNILGPLQYHDGTGFAAVPDGTAIVIGDNPSGTLQITADTMSLVTGPGVIGQADAGGVVHAHISYNLTPSSLGAAEFGAYGLLMQLTTDASDIASSDSFYLVFNFGLDEPTFESAVGDFAALVPEPASLVLLSVGMMTMLRRRRGGCSVTPAWARLSSC